MSRLDIISQLFHFMETHGQSDYIGEQVTQLEHMIQAAMLAQNDKTVVAGHDELIVACLLHDIGNFLDHPSMISPTGLKIGTLDHEVIGANYLSQLGFNDLVCDLVRNHVQAKRYLLSVNPNYTLSQASLLTLQHQGGLMTPDEILQFQHSPHFNLYLIMRRIDEQAKCTNIRLESLESFLEICQKCLKPYEFGVVTNNSILP